LIEMGVRMPPPVPAGGFCSAPSMAISSTHPRATWDDQDVARAKELHNLRLALATFALQLDAFELRTSRGQLKAGMKREMLVLPPDAGRELQRDRMIGRQ
jgi:hypothetical protein